MREISMGRRREWEGRGRMGGREENGREGREWEGGKRMGGKRSLYASLFWSDFGRRKLLVSNCAI
jgi:hypothetical protein